MGRRVPFAVGSAAPGQWQTIERWQRTVTAGLCIGVRPVRFSRSPNRPALHPLGPRRVGSCCHSGELERTATAGSGHGQSAADDGWTVRVRAGDARQVLNVLELERLFNERYFEPSMDVPTFYRQARRASCRDAWLRLRRSVRQSAPRRCAVSSRIRMQIGHAVRVFTGAVGLDATMFDTAVIIDDPVKVISALCAPSHIDAHPRCPAGYPNSRSARVWRHCLVHPVRPISVSLPRRSAASRVTLRAPESVETRPRPRPARVFFSRQRHAVISCTRSLLCVGACVNAFVPRPSSAFKSSAC